MNYTGTELAILKNFASINPSLKITSKGLSTMSVDKTVIGFYNFEKPYSDYDSYCVYNTPNFLTAIGVYNEPNFDIKDKYVVISETDKKLNNSSIKYFTTPENAIEPVKEEHVYIDYMDKLDIKMSFKLTNEHLSTIFKISSILKSNYVFFETDDKKIKVTIADDLSGSFNSYQFFIEEGITVNALESDKCVRFDIGNIKVYAQGDYKVDITSGKITKWTNEALNIRYFIGTNIKSN